MIVAVRSPGAVRDKKEAVRHRGKWQWPLTMTGGLAAGPRPGTICQWASNERIGAGKEEEQPWGGILLGDTTASTLNGAPIVLSDN